MSYYSYDESYEGHEFRMYHADNNAQRLEVRSDNYDGEIIYASGLQWDNYPQMEHQARGFIDGYHQALQRAGVDCRHGDEDELKEFDERRLNK